MSTDEGISAVRQVFTDYLTGPGVQVEVLAGRLAAHAREEAREKKCEFVLFTTAIQKRKSRSTGLLGRLAAGAVQSGASQVAMNSGSAGTRVAASAAAGAASNTYIASTIRTSDELSLTARLEAPGGAVLVETSGKRKAHSDGEDLLSPLVESAAGEIVAALPKK